ncbi:major capsid protein [Leeia sp. TBRC 13508]|uniref:Major capsid protein n=1 Tax=Leeia speluncae TaxID=2884804 RepID=A0ABS8D288_9NEIS|nr:major capsid protein [Leeia speluncae]MCB6182318.1 major capsid protein [Leeia speluncae]
MPMSGSQVRVINPILSTVVQGYRQQGLVGSELFPRIPVEVSAGQILEFDKTHFLQVNAARAPGGRTARIQFGYLGKPFVLNNQSLEAPVPREYLRDASVVPGIDLGSRAVNVVMKNLLMQLEMDQATVALNASSYGASNKVALTGTSKWSDTTSDPGGQLEGYKDAVRQSCGVYPNVLLLSAQAWKTLKQHPTIKDRLKYTGRDSLTTDMLAKLWDLDKVVVGAGVKADDAGVLSDIWGNNAVLAYVPQASQSIEEPSYGYTYTMNGHPLVEEPYYENSHKAWIYGVGFERVPVLSGIASGYLIQNPA